MAADNSVEMRRSGDRPMVNRERELAALEAGLVEAGAGHGRLFLIAGEPGIGKTRLAEAVAGRGAAQGMLPLWGRAWESAGAPAYWPWAQVLRQLVASRDDDAALAGELGAGASWISQVLPELSDRLPDIAPSRLPSSDKARFALFEAVASFLRDAAASDRLVIVFDDLHAADAGSLLMFEFVARQVSDAPILMLATFQEAAARLRPDLKKLLGDLARESRTLALGGFGEEEVSQMVQQQSGEKWPPELLEALQEATEGNPFFTTEVIRLLSGNGQTASLLDDRGHVRFPLPDTIRETVRRRFESLSRQTVEALEVAAVIGREFRIATVERATGESPLIGPIDEAATAGLVSEVEDSIGRFRFCHNLIRQTLYEDLGPARRVELHRGVAEAIEQSHGETADRFTELAFHFSKASPGGDAARALDYAVRAGDEAMRMFAYEQAAQHYELAREMGDLLGPDAKRTAGLLLARGQALARADHLGARDALIAAGEAAREAGEPGLLADAALSMRAWPLGSGLLDEQPSKLLSEALERMPERDSSLRARLLARLSASLYYWPGTEQRRKALVEEAVAIARRLGDPETLASALSNSQLATWGPDYTERDLGWMEELLPLVQLVRDDELELIARNRQIDLLVELADLPAADAALRALELTVSECSDPRAEGYVCLQRARHAIIEGRYPEAERLNAEAVKVGSQLRDPNMTILARNQIAGLRWCQGRFAEVEPEIREMTNMDSTPAWPAALIRVSCELGREGEARRVLERLATNGFADVPRYNGWLITIALLSEACVMLRDLERVEQLYEVLHPFAERNISSPQAVFAGPVARYLGILAAGLGAWEKATAHFAAARASGERMNSPPTLLRVALDEAHMLAARDRSGDRDRALELLGEAHELAAELRVDRITDQIEMLRGRLGGEERVEPVAAVAEDTSVANLRREGEVWAFDYGPRSIRVRDGKGVRYLAILLASPGREVHALELVGLDGGMAPETGSASVAMSAEVGGTSADDAGPVLDAAAKTAYRGRLEELREEVEEAEAFNDPERVARAREEMDFLAQELAGAVGLGGRDRKAASSAERARVSVTKAIRTTIKRLSEHDPVLGRELDTTVRTGVFCTYEPDPRHPLRWRVNHD